MSKRLKVVRRTAHYCDLLRLRALGLFASHAWFWHEENAHMNDWAVPPREALAFMIVHSPSNLQAHALMHRDRWLARTGFVDADDGLSAWDEAIARCRSEDPVARGLVPLDDLLEAASAYLAQLRNAAAEEASRPPPAEPLDVHVEDLGVSLRLSLRDFTLSEQPVPRADCHLSLGFQAFANCFLFRGASDTLDTSGRYTLQRLPNVHPVLLLCYAQGAAYGTGSPFGWQERLARLLARRGEWLDERMKR